MKAAIRVLLASPRGFCAGVVRAIETVNLTIKSQGAPVYVLHEIVHNKHVISELARRQNREEAKKSNGQHDGCVKVALSWWLG